MNAEYDPKTGDSSYPNETDEARQARERREEAKQGQPAEGSERDAEAGTDEERHGKHVGREGVA